MSVPRSERSSNKMFGVLLMARKLASYTITITKNQTTFPPEYQYGITNDIITCAKNIFLYCWTANNIRVNNDPKQWERRKALEEKAALECNNLLALMQIAQEVFHLKTKRIRYWGKKTIETRGRIRSWTESDMKRYGYLEEEVERHNSEDNFDEEYIDSLKLIGLEEDLENSNK